MREIVLVLDNIRSTYNVGAILRTAEGFGVKEVILSGWTPDFTNLEALPHQREKLKRQIHKTALGAEDMLKIYSSGGIISELRKLRKRGYQIVGLENNIPEKTVLLGSKETKQRVGDKIVLVLGEEVHGIDYSLHDIIDLFLEIPMRGKKESFNVSVAAGIALFSLAEENVI